MLRENLVGSIKVSLNIAAVSNSVSKHATQFAAVFVCVIATLNTTYRIVGLFAITSVLVHVNVYTTHYK